MMRSFPLLEKESKLAEIPKNLESSWVWMPLSPSASENHLPALSFQVPAVPSLSFHLLTVQRLSQPASKVSEKKVLALDWCRNPKRAAAVNFTMTKLKLRKTKVKRLKFKSLQ